MGTRDEGQVISTCSSQAPGSLQAGRIRSKQGGFAGLAFVPVKSSTALGLGQALIGHYFVKGSLTFPDFGWSVLAAGGRSSL